jgi:L-asparaginase II.
MMFGIPYEGYIEPEHEAQKLSSSMLRWRRVCPKTNWIDGCGVPVFYLPIYNMSLAYARLSTPTKGDWGDYEDAATKIRDAMRDNFGHGQN